MENDTNIVEVLGNGYVRLVDSMGDDLSVVNAARASFAKESKELSPKDARLIDFLIRENHMSPFRHAFMTFEIKAPLMVARQHWKYVVGSDHTMDSWNESSRRYVTMDPEFYVPESDQWRMAPEDKKQGSGGPIGPWHGALLTDELKKLIKQGEALYNMALEQGVAPEQARLFLPAYGMHVVYRWSCSLQSVCLFLTQRLAEDSQVEIQEYAKAVYALSKEKFPITIGRLVG
ncbi:FAD-dependent thymidylate synthase [bacterium]|nr:FAD-dependent thymidylate synthase [Candidatus Elulimicrobium humile]